MTNLLRHSFVDAKCDRCRPAGIGLDHVQRGQSFGRTIGLRQAGVDQQAVAVLHQPVTDEAQLRLRMASGSVVEAWVSLERFCRGSPPPLCPPPCAGGSPRAVLGLDDLHRGPGLDQRAIDREVIARQKFLHLGSARTAAKNFAAMSPSSSRSRFFENTEWSDAVSSMPIPQTSETTGHISTAPSEAARTGSNETPATAIPAASQVESTAAQSANRARQTGAPAPPAFRSRWSGSLAADDHAAPAPPDQRS
ncbi:hypothetical protein ACVWYQ_003330 [Bradyrhizobium sp. USDA 3397]